MNHYDTNFLLSDLSYDCKVLKTITNFKVSYLYANNNEIVT